MSPIATPKKLPQTTVREQEQEPFSPAKYKSNLKLMQSMDITPKSAPNRA